MLAQGKTAVVLHVCKVFMLLNSLFLYILAADEVTAADFTNSPKWLDEKVFHRKTSPEKLEEQVSSQVKFHIVAAPL